MYISRRNKEIGKQKGEKTAWYVGFVLFFVFMWFGATQSGDRSPLISALELLQDVFTEQMNAILKNILPVLIKYPNSSIHDLLDFLSTTDTQASKYSSDRTKSNKA